MPRNTFLIIVLVLLSAACLPDQHTELLTPAPSLSPAGPIWKPSGAFSWQIQFDGSIDLKVGAEVFELDAFETSERQVSQLHTEGRRVICYLNAGAWEDWRPDREAFPPAIIGLEYAGWEGERWLDIRQVQLLEPILVSRLEMCRQKGFDGVEFDNVDGYDNETGFPLTPKDQLIFNKWLAEQAHWMGLRVGLKNDPEQAAALEPFFDFAVVESCFAEGWCDQMRAFLEAGKPVLAIEYTDEVRGLAEYCDQAKDLGISLILKRRSLDGFRKTCE